MSFKIKTFGVAACAIFMTSLSIAPAFADDTGLAASLHELRKEKRRLCQVDHFHFGNSAGHPNKKIAMAHAVDSWQSFTALEYGSDWADFRKAGSASAKCTVFSGGWGCEVQARPCK